MAEIVYIQRDGVRWRARTGAEWLELALGPAPAVEVLDRAQNLFPKALVAMIGPPKARESNVA